MDSSIDALRGLGEACLLTIEAVRRRSPSAQIYLLGFSGLLGQQITRAKVKIREVVNVSRRGGVKCN